MVFAISCKNSLSVLSIPPFDVTDCSSNLTGLRILIVSGLDLCYGRWDNCKHYLTDCDSDFIPSESSKMVCSIAILLHQLIATLALLPVKA